MKSIFVKVRGIVQGVGFRPYVYNLCTDLGLTGWVNNDDEGVNIALEGTSENIDQFLNTLRQSPPPLAKIDQILEEEKEVENFTSFDIHKSENTSNKTTIISPDIAICDDCIDDINDENNFRYNYALTNCTNCGPRYTIINTVPYDRCNTSMKDFPLCPKCGEEYQDPANRRYHAQPVSCEKCGPKIALFDKQNSCISEDYAAIVKIAKLINSGEIVAIKGLGGFHLVCDATNDKAVETLRQRKSRPTKPYAVMFKDIEQIKEFATLTDAEEKLITSKEKPITLVRKKENTVLSELVAPDIDRLGCFIGYTPLHILLFRHLNNPIIATSANLKDEPIIRGKDEVYEKLGSVVDFVLDYDREIINACDDSVVQVVNSDISKLRNARGYAPTTIKLQQKLDKKILAFGGNQKVTISLAFEDNLILSPHIGDLNTIEAMEYFVRTIDTFKRFYDFEPDVIVCDKHPNYENTKYAKTLEGKKVVQIQHHYAHILSTMAEFNLKQEVLGFAFDGTGYGDDGKIWGGEVFVCDNKNYKRVNHLKYFKLLGGEKAVKEPKRVALSLLFDAYSLEEVLTLETATVKAFDEKEIKLMYTMWQRGLNAPETSSFGRLFDAIASLCNIAHTQSYEGETGLQIEKNYDSSILETYDYTIGEEGIDLVPMIKQIVKDEDRRVVCSKFINTIAHMVITISNSYEDLPIVLSGGVFQNKTLLELLCTKLDKLNKKYYYSKEVPLNDGGLSVGQLYYEV